MGLFSNPVGYAGYPPGASAPATVVNSTVRAATATETAAGTLGNAYVSPATLGPSITLDFASPSPIGSTTPNTGKFTTLQVTTGPVTLGEGVNIVGGTATGSKIGTATTQKFGFYNATPVIQQTQAALTNSVTAGGVTGTIANYTDLTVYANDATAIRNDIYQLSLALSNVITALRTYGLLG